MNQGTHPEELPAEVLADVASVVGAEVTLLSRLPGGVNAGAMRPVVRKGKCSAQSRSPGTPQPPGRDVASQRVVEHMRRRGYPTLARSGGHSYSCMASDGLR
jgi:hypothetical protein